MADSRAANSAPAARPMISLRSVVSTGPRNSASLRVWEQNLLAHYAEAIELVGESTVTDFRRYLHLSATGFRAGIVSLLRMSFQKKD
jgi:cyclopropane-fatty-acyl-phospholipid synthase